MEEALILKAFIKTKENLLSVQRRAGIDISIKCDMIAVKYSEAKL
jgi:ferredoxin